MSTERSNLCPSCQPRGGHTQSTTVRHGDRDPAAGMAAPPDAVSSQQPPKAILQAHQAPSTHDGVRLTSILRPRRAALPRNRPGAGGLRFQINSWSLALSGILPRETFDAIVAELNSTCDKHAPSVGAHMAWLLVPVLGLAAIPVLMNKLAHFKRQVDATCALLNKQYAASGINLRVVEFSQAAAMGSCGNNGMCRGAQRGHCHRRRHHCNHGVVTFRVDLEVAA